MKIKRLFSILVAMSVLTGSSFAQQSKSDESLEFRPNWSVQAQVGAAYTLGEGAFGDLLSPAAALSAKYQFHHALGVRVGLGGWQGKGIVCSPEQDYAFKFVQLNADFMVNICSLFDGFDHKRVVNPYVFAGIGGAYGFDNDEAVAISDKGPGLDYLWRDSRFFLPIRMGLGVDFRCSDRVSVGLEANANMLSDRFNSKKADNSDWQFNLMAGVTYRFGDNTRPSVVYAEQQRAIAERLAAERAAAERAAAEKAAAEKAAAEKAAAEKAAAEKAAAERAAAEKAARRAAQIEEHSDNVFFLIGSSYIRKSEAKKLDALVEWLKANPDFNVLVVGYADKATGNATINSRISQKRADNVKKYLVNAGIDEARLETNYKGDTVQPFEEIAKNRVVICTLE